MEEARQHGSKQSRRHMRVLAGCVALVAGMGGLAYASVPLYELFCQVTGYGGTTRGSRMPVSGFPTSWLRCGSTPTSPRASTGNSIPRSAR